MACSVEERAVQLERILDRSSFSLRTCAAQSVEGAHMRILILVSGSFEALGVHKGFSQTFLIEGDKEGQDVLWRISNDMLVIL